MTALLAFGAAPANANFIASPLRVVLTADTPTTSVSISNPTERILEGDIRWIDFAITETGYRPASNAERQEISAAPRLMVSPAHFRLEPGERIEIAIVLRDGAAPAAGEKRSHLMIETRAARTLVRKISDNGLQADIGAAISIPVIVRGKGRGDADIGETRLLRDNDGMLLLAAKISALGGHSTFGRLSAIFEPQGELEPRTLFIRDNVTTHPRSPARAVEAPLGYFALGEGVLTLRYEGDGEFAGVLFDERRFDIAPPK